MTSLPGGRRRVVAFAVTAEHSPEQRALPRSVRGAIEAGRKLGWDMVDLDQWHLRIPASLRPDGLLLSLSRHRLPAALELIHAVPAVVSLDSWFLAGRVPGVLRDEQAVGICAATYLLGRGFRNVAITGFKRTGLSSSLLAFQRRMKREGCCCTLIPALDVHSRDETRKGEYFKRQLAKLTFPLAIFCVNDRLAARVCRWCLEAGVEIPEQVTVLGAGNDILACECSPVPISSVDLCCEQRGREAALLLQRLMDGEAVPEQPVLVQPGEVYTRRSTDILAIPDLAAARALRYMWDHYAENIGGDEIAESCGIPRRSLDRHFRAAFGRTLNQELSRERLSHACSLLTGTEIPAADVAARVGFHSEQYFCSKFKRAFGCPPNTYRIRERVTAAAPDEPALRRSAAVVRTAVGPGGES